MLVNGSTVYIHPVHSFAAGHMLVETIISKKWKSFLWPEEQDFTQVGEPVTMFTDEINEAMNARRACLMQAESEMVHLEEIFNGEHSFIDKFASGNAEDVVTLNGSGAVMVTKRSTVCTAEDSALAQQFDYSKQTGQGCHALCVKEWTPDEV